MLRARFIPTLLLRGRGLYKTVKFKNETYVGDPINAVRIFNDKAVDELILLDMDAHRRGGGPNFELIADIASEATTLYDRWPQLTIDDRRKIAEALCEKIVIGDGEIDLTLSYHPSSEELCKNQTHL